MIRLYLVAAAATLSLSCAWAGAEWDTLRPRSTPDCSLWIDGSFYPVGRNSLGADTVGAMPPRFVDGALELKFVYFVTAGKVIRPNSQTFLAVTPSGTRIATGQPLLLLNPHSKNEAPRYAELPAEFPGSSTTSDRTLYVVVVKFTNLPERFDVILPDIWLDERKFPVRVFAYNSFPEKMGTGLCQ